MDTGTAGDPKFKSVLIVEDEPAIRETLKQIVELEGYQAVTAANGKEALRILKSPQCPEPCLVLLDLMMPEMNGWQFLEVRRNSDVIASIPVLVLSAANPGKLPDGSVKFMRKPVDLEQLLQRVSAACQQDQKRAA